MKILECKYSDKNMITSFNLKFIFFSQRKVRQKPPRFDLALQFRTGFIKMYEIVAKNRVKTKSHNF